MKRTLKSVVAATIVLGTVVPSVFAANSNTNGAPTDITGDQFAPAIGLMINDGVMINYSGNTFKPTSTASRGQAIAYLYNILSNEGVITQDYTGANPFFDEDNFFQKQINDMYLFGYLDGLDFSDKSGNDVIGEYWTTPVTWLSQLLCNVAGVAYDNTKAWDAYKVAVAQGWFANSGYADGSMPKTGPSGNGYYIQRDQLAQVLENFYASQYPSSTFIKGAPVSLKVSAATATVGQGSSDQLTVSGTDLFGNAATIDPSMVTYSVYGDSSSNANSGFINSNGLFTATASGNYTVTATYGTAIAASATVSVFGGPTAIVVKGGNLVADGSFNDSTQVTATLVDGSGSTVTNYNGPVTLTLNSAADGSFSSSSSVLTTTVNAVNGVATVTVYNGTAPVAGDTLTVTATEYNNSSISGTASISVAAQSATSLGVNYASGQPNGLAVNTTSAPTAIVVTALDQAGKLINTYNNWATLTISGPGTFASTGTATQTVWLGAGTTSNITINGKQGVTGSVVVTATAPGLGTQTFTIPAYVQTGVATLVATPSKTTVGADGTDSTTITVKALDSNGNLMLSDNNPLSISDNNVSSGALTYTAASGYTAGHLNNGEYQFTVTDHGYKGADTVTVTDASDSLSASDGLTFTSGVASKVAAVASSVYGAAGATVPLTFQVEDAGGNAIAQAGDVFNLSATTGGTLSATSATTDANGQFTVNVTLPSTGSVVVTAAPTSTESSAGLSGSGTETISVENGANLATSVTSDVYSGGNTYTVNAGVPVYLDVYGLNAIGGVTGTTDSFSVTSSNSSILEVLGSTTPGGPFSSSVTSGIPGRQGTASAAGYIEVKPLLGGSATITLKDTSVVGTPSETITFTVQPTNTLGSLTLNGLTSGQYVTAGTTYPLTISLADAGGNPIYATSSTPGYNGTSGVVVSLSDFSTLNGDFRATNGTTLPGTVVIPTGANSVTVDWVAPASGSGNVTASVAGSFTGSTSVTVQ